MRLKEDDEKRKEQQMKDSTRVTLKEQNKADNKAGNVGGGGGDMAGEKAARTSLYWMRLRIGSTGCQTAAACAGMCRYRFVHDSGGEASFVLSQSPSLALIVMQQLRVGVVVGRTGLGVRGYDIVEREESRWP